LLDKLHLAVTFRSYRTTLDKQLTALLKNLLQRNLNRKTHFHCM
jgi:hypothetical protein